MVTSRMATKVFTALLLLVSSGCERCDDVDVATLVPLAVPRENRIDFGAVFVGASRERSTEIFSAGTAPVLVHSLRLEGDDAFTIVQGGPATLEPGEGLQLALALAPESEGPAQATLIVVNDSQNAPSITIELVGQGLAPLDCDDGNSCTDDRFDADGGRCVHSEGAGACDDGSACTENDRCLQGTCVGEPVFCDDDVPCTRDLCDALRGCAFVPDDAACADDDPCSLDLCGVTGCENPPAPDGFPCGALEACVSVEVCIAQRCTALAVPEGTECDDRDVCTAGDRCEEGSCVGTPSEQPPMLVNETVLMDPAGLTSQVRSATLLDDVLYMESVSQSGGAAALVAFRIGDAHVEPFAVLPELGRLRLLPPAPAVDLHVGTVAGDGDWDADIVLVDTSDSARPAVVDTIPSAPSRFRGAVGASAGRVWWCEYPSSGGFPGELFSSDVLAGPRLGPAVRRDGDVCGTGADSVVADGGRWLSVPASGPAALYTISADGAVRAGSIDLASADGQLERRAVVMDGERVIVPWGPANRNVDASLQLVDTTDPSDPLAAELTPPFSQWLFLALVERIAYLATTEGLRAYDVTDVHAPVLLPWSADVAYDPAINDRPVLLTADAARLVVLSSQGLSVRLAVLPAAAASPQASREVRGLGYLERLEVGASGVYGLSERSAVRFDPAALLGQQPVAAPPWLSFAAHAPTLVDGPDGPMGMLVPSLRDTVGPCSDFAPYLCDTVLPIHTNGAGGELHAVDIQEDGTFAWRTSLSIAWPHEETQRLIALSVERCVGAAFVDAPEPRVVIVDRCSANAAGVGLTVLGEVPLPDVDQDLTAGLSMRGFIHDEDFATFTDGVQAWLVDLRSPLSPILAAQVSLEGAGRLVGTSAGVEGGLWVLALSTADVGDNESFRAPQVRIYDVTQQEPTLLSQWNLTAEPLTLTHPFFGSGPILRRVLGVHWPRLYLSDHEGGDRYAGHRLLIYDLATSPPALEREIALASEPVDLVVADDTVFVARGDGISVITPPCGP